VGVWGEAPANKRFGAYLSQKGSFGGSNFCGVFSQEYMQFSLFSAQNN